MAKFQPAFGVMKSMGFENIGTAYLSGFMSERSKMNRNLRQLALSAGSGTGSARATQTRQNMKYDALLKEKRALQRELADLNKTKRELQAGEQDREKDALAFARQRVATDLAAQGKLQSKRQREINEAESDKEKRSRVIGRAKDTSKLSSKINKAWKDAGLPSGVESLAGVQELYSAGAENKDQMKKVAKQVLLNNVFMGKSPDDELFADAGITEEQYVDSWIKDVLVNRKVESSKIKDLEKRNQSIFQSKKKEAEKLSNDPMSTEDALDFYREYYLKNLKKPEDVTAYFDSEEKILKDKIKNIDISKEVLLGDIGGTRAAPDLYGDVQLSSEYDLPASMMDELFYVPGRQITDPALLDEVDEVAMEKDFDPTLGLGRAQYEMGGAGQISDTVRGRRPEMMRGVERTSEPVYGQPARDFSAGAAADSQTPVAIEPGLGFGQQRERQQEAMVPSGDMLPMRDPTIRRYTYEPEPDEEPKRELMPVERTAESPQMDFDPIIAGDFREIPRDDIGIGMLARTPALSNVQADIRTRDEKRLDAARQREREAFAAAQGVDFDRGIRRGQTGLERSEMERQRVERSRQLADENARRQLFRQVEKELSSSGFSVGDLAPIRAQIEAEISRTRTTPSRLSPREQEQLVARAFNSAVQQGVLRNRVIPATQQEMALADDPVALMGFYKNVLGKRR